MKIFKPPTKFPKDKAKLEIFLAGSIEMGTAIDWQDKVQKIIGEIEENDDINIFNPRRDNWDPSVKQTIENRKFREQVEWELNGLDRSNLIICYFDGQTKSPITLMEMGLHARENKLIVFCPKDFWRKGNVDIVAKKHNFPVYEKEKEFLEAVKSKIKSCLK